MTTYQNVEEEAVADWHKSRFRVPLFEVDLGQAVYHGNYFHIFELAREAFLRDMGYPYRRFMDQELHLTVVETTCSYRRPLRYDDLIEINSRILWWRRRSLAFSQNIYRLEESEEQSLCTKATLNMVCVRFSGKPTTIPEDFTILLKAQGIRQVGQA